MQEILYETERVSMIYKKGREKANQEISLQIKRGEIVGVLGPNGAGKSTLIKQLVGHLKPTEGRVLYNGIEVYKQTRTIASQVAYFAQEPHVLNALTAREALVYTGQLRGVPKFQAMQEADELLERFEMPEARNKQLKRLSGGQKRMVGIGTALIGQSPVLILDEPTNELDPVKRRLVWELISEYNLEGTTVILVTHNVKEAEQVVDRVAVINHGRLLALDSVVKLKQRVDQRLKFEIQTAYGASDDVREVLKGWGIIQRHGANRLSLLVNKENAGDVLDMIVSSEDLPVDEFSVLPPSLEDVYFHIDNEGREGA